MDVRLATLRSFYDNSLALDYIAAYALADPTLGPSLNIRTILQSESADPSPAIEELLDDHGDVVGFNTYVWNIEETVQAARLLKLARPGITIVFGGMEATYTASRLIADVPWIDFVVVGEGELNFLNLLKQLQTGKSFSGVVPGIVYRDMFGLAAAAIPGPIVETLDDIPSPFTTDAFRRRGGGRILYESYRGCAFSCGFCLYHRDYTKQRYFSMERVAADLRAIRDAGCSHVRFVDSTFNIHPRRTKEILGLIAGINADVSVEVSAEFFDAETVDMLAPAGIRHVDIGLQSTNRNALAAVNRKWYKEDRFRANLTLLRDHPALTLNVELIAGLPFDDLAGLKNSIDEAVALWPDHLSIYRLLGLKGTEVEKRKVEFGLRFSDAAPYELLESPGFSANELRHIELLTFAHLMLFNMGIGRYALRCAMEQTNRKATDLYQDFLLYALSAGGYPETDARFLGKYYAYGNRFDRDLPPGLEPERIRDVVVGFFLASQWSAEAADFSRLLSALVAYGYQLAVLDRAEDRAHTATVAADSERLGIAPWCHRESFHEALYSELARQGAPLEAMEASDIASVLFFVHPDFGPASLGLDDATQAILAAFETPFGARAADLPEGEEASELIRTLVNWKILVPYRRDESASRASDSRPRGLSGAGDGNAPRFQPKSTAEFLIPSS